MSTFETLTFAQNDAVATLTLNRSNVRSAFSEAVIAKPTGAFHTLADEPGMHAIVLTGNDPAFCMGTDPNWTKKMAGYPDDESRADALRLAEMLHAVYTCPKPAITRVQSGTYVDGVGLVATYDIVVVADTANFCLSETGLGLIPTTINPYVIHALGEQAPRRYFITTECLSTARAHRLGLVHELVSADTLDVRVADITTTLIVNSLNAVRESRHLVRKVSDAAVSDALLVDTTEHITAIHASEESHEGVQSFLGKRKPNRLLPA